MIAAIQGTLQHRGTNWAIVKVGGVSFQVYIPGSTLSRLGAVGDEVHLHTYLHFREDNMALYGFATAEELGLFQAFISVSGVGPRVALALLSALSSEQLALAIASGNVDLLSQVPGIGKKVASRLVLELKGKIEKSWVGVSASPLSQESAEVVVALTALGYSLMEATQALDAIPDSSELSLEDKVKLALQYLARK
jgi:Holliday junction DNA helicase RuvA